MNLLLQEDHESCHQLLSSLGTAASLSRVDERGGFSLLAMNDACRAFFGMQPMDRITKLNMENVEQLTGSGAAETEAYLDRLLANYQQVVRTRQQLATENDYLTSKGETRWSRSTFTPVFNRTAVARIMVTFQDITEIRQTQEALEKSLAGLFSQLIRYCSSCGKVQDRSGDWLTITNYLSVQNGHQLSHGICKRCISQYGFGDKD